MGIATKIARAFIGVDHGRVPVTQPAAAPITGWAVHNGTSTAGGTAASPIFTPGDNITLMAPFDAVVAGRW